KGMAKIKINILPASSIFAATDPRPASLVILEPISVIYAIPIIFKIVSIYKRSTLALSHKDVMSSIIVHIFWITMKNIIMLVTIIKKNAKDAFKSFNVR